jgi:beta-glucosidase
MVVPYVKGVQSKNVITCTKHFVANNQEWNRFDVSAEMDERTLREIYFPAFKSAIREGDSWTIMAAYNRFRGTYACENKYLLNDVLKDEWGFTGIAVSDWGGARSTVPMAQSGLDLEMPTGKYYGDRLLKAIKDGEVTEALLDDEVGRILRVMFKAGLFDESIDQYGGHSDQLHRRQLALQVARQSIILLKNEDRFLPLDRSAVKSIAVIGPNGIEARMEGGGSGGLTGNYGISPLQGIKNKAGDDIKVEFERGIPERPLELPIAGPEYFLLDDGSPGINAEYFNNREQEGDPVYTCVEKDINFDWGYGSPKQDVVRPEKWSARWTGKLKSPGEGWYEIGLKADNGIRMYIDGIKILDAWIDASPGKFKIARYKFEANRVYDIQVDFYENIGTCRCKLGFAPYEPGSMMDNAVKLASVSDVVVLAVGLDRTPALIEALYPGQEGGNVLAEILFGDVSPSGKLPLTFPEKWEDSPAYVTYPGDKEIAYYKEGIFVGYRHFDNENIEPLFPFGFGLSYTSFEYRGLELSQKKISQGDTLTVKATIRNSGIMNGDEVVQLYIRDVKASVEREVKALKGFARIGLDPGETKDVIFKVDRSHLQFYDVNSNSWVDEPGEFEVMLGSSSRDIRLKDAFHLIR